VRSGTVTRGRLLAGGLALVALLAGAVVLDLGPFAPDGPDALVEAASARHPDLEFVIPAGTAAAARRGAAPELIPNPLRVRVGQTLRVRNEDVAQQIGPFFLREGETITQRFVAEGRLVGACAAHPSGRIAIEIRA
jgi:hypothetical protein